MRVPVTFNSCTHPTTDNKEIKYKKQVVSLVISLINSLMYFLLLLIYLSYFSFCFSHREAALYGLNNNMSLNSVVENALQNMVENNVYHPASLVREDSQDFCYREST